MMDLDTLHIQTDSKVCTLKELLDSGASQEILAFFFERFLKLANYEIGKELEEGHVQNMILIFESLGDSIGEDAPDA